MDDSPIQDEPQIEYEKEQGETASTQATMQALQSRSSMLSTLEDTNSM